MFVSIGVRDIPPFIFAGARFLLAGFFLALFMILSRKRFVFTATQLANAVLIGFLFLSFGNGGVSWALQHVDSGVTALLISTQPLIVLLLLRLLYGQRIKLFSWFGVALGIIGIYLLVEDLHLTNDRNTYLGIFIIFLCLISWAYASIRLKSLDMPPTLVQSTMLQMITGGFILFTFGLLSGEDVSSFKTISGAALGSLFFLVFFGSIVAFTSFNFLLQHVSPEKVSTSTYINPIVAVILGVTFLHEEFTPKMIMASLVLLSGVYFINQTKAVPPKVEEMMESEAPVEH